MSTVLKNVERRTAFVNRIVSFQCNQSDLDRLVCVSCWDLLTGFLRSCDQNHPHCGECKSRLMSCTVEYCSRRGPLWQPGWLNHREEELMTKVAGCTINCVNVQQGCNAILKSEDYRAHLLMCNFRDVCCLYTELGGCSVNFAPQNWIPHLMDAHNVNLNLELSQDLLVPFIWDRPMNRTIFLPMGIILHCGTNFVVNVYMAVLNETVGGNDLACSNLFFWVSTLVTPTAPDHTFQLTLFQRLSTGDELVMTMQSKVHDSRLSQLDIVRKQKEDMCALHVTILPTSLPRVNRKNLFVKVKIVWNSVQ